MNTKEWFENFKQGLEHTPDDTGFGLTPLPQKCILIYDQKFNFRIGVSSESIRPVETKIKPHEFTRYMQMLRYARFILHQLQKDQ